LENLFDGDFAEGSGEDPYLGALMAGAYVRGYQGDGMKQNNEIMACVKHFALYGASESGRDYNSVDMSRNLMYNVYLAPYKGAVEAGVGSVMSSFNTINGVPATADKWLLTDLLRNEWGFTGFVVTDYNSIGEMKTHGVADLKEASARALNAGTDMDMVAHGFLHTLEASLKEKAVTQERIDEACRRVLEAKYKLGLFENPYKYCDTLRGRKELFTEANRKAAREIAAETFVLLKNEGKLLPLQKKGRIALIGPMADAQNNMCGTWNMDCQTDRHVTMYEAFRRAVGDKATVSYAKGSNVYYSEHIEKGAVEPRPLTRGDDRQLRAEALRVAASADVIVAALGESAEMSGESSSRTDIQIPDAQKDLLKALVATGKPVVLALFTGRPLDLCWESEHVPAILNVWFAGSEAGDAIADVMFGDVSPSGKLTTSFPRAVGQLPLYYNHLNTGRPDTDDTTFNRYGRLLGLRVEENGWQFMSRDPKDRKWRALTGDKLLGPVTLPEGMTLAAELEGFNWRTASDERQEQGRDERERTPQILVFPGGELSPFVLTLSQQDEDLHYLRTVRGDEFGRLSLLQDEEEEE
jgi:beta-glucosidase